MLAGIVFCNCKTIFAFWKYPETVTPLKMLWADKHRPKDLEKLDYHKEQAQDLKNLTKDGDFPHLLVYGPNGAGKKTRIMCLLKQLYGSGVERLKLETQTFVTPSNKKFDVQTVTSNYHIEVNPSDVGIYDRVVVMELIKNVAQTQQLNANAQRDFKVIVLTDTDSLTRDAQHALRRTMEKYITNCRLILCATSISRVIPAIKSRCLCIRMPAPSEEDVVNVIQKVCKKEDIKIPQELAVKIARTSGRNVRRALLMLEAARVEKYPFDPDQNVTEPDWEVFIKKIATTMLQKQDPATVMKIREHIYELLTNGIPKDIVFKQLLKELLKNLDVTLKGQVVAEAAEYEHRMSQANKEIFHIEAFVVKFMCMYQSFIQGMAMDF